MKQYLYNTLFRSLLLLLAVALPTTVFADEETGDVSDAESAAMAKTKQYAPVMQETDPTGANYLDARYALVGKHCAVNRLINVVKVGTGTSGLANLTNENIDDYASFPQVISATVAVSPLVSVRDMKHYYAGGTTAGFCIVAAGGGSVLSLDLVKTYHIWFYCDGKRVADQTVREANGGSGVKLTLIGVPGTDSTACANLTAVCPVKFDEVALVQGGAVDAEVGSVIRIRYAFVGDAHDINMTHSGIDDYTAANGLPSFDVSCEAMMPSPLVGGIPIPVVASYRERAIDDNLTNTVPLVSALQLASVAFKGNVDIYCKNSDASVDELFHAGDQVGFKYNFVEVADVLKLAQWVQIHLYDKQGNQVQSTSISASALALSIASGGDQTCYIQAANDFSGAGIYFYTALGLLNLGSGFGVYGAFVRPRPLIDHECEINATCNTNLCASQTTHQLKSNPEVNVTWSLVSQPTENAGACSVTPDGFITGMNADGTYKFLATAEDGCTETVVITHGDSEDFLEPVVEHALYNIDSASPEYALSDDLHGETSANLLSISDMDNPDNVLNPDLTDCASYTGGLQLLGSNGVIVGIKKLSATDPYIYDGSKATAKDEIQIGFVVEMEQTALGLNLLNAFQIRCFDEAGTKVYQHIVEDAGVLGLGLIGSNDKSNKLRLSITVPKVNGDGDPVKINEFQLWKIGTIDLHVSDVKFYYAFWNDPTDAQNNIIRDGAYVVNYDNMGAMVNIGTQVNVASVGGVTNNLSNIIDIDDELETYALMQKTVESGSTEIIVKLGRTLDFRHQVGVVVNNDIVGLNANVGNVLKIGTFHNGTETGEAASNWGVLGANVIQGSGKTVLLISPTADYDEIHITAGEGLAANRTIKIYGILIRNDVDHDGVPDNRDESSCSTTISNIEVNHVCQGASLSIRALGTTDTKYYISFPEQDIEMAEVQSDISGWITGDYLTKKAGQYVLYFYDGNKDLLSTAEYTVHPLVTTWRTTTNNTNWNTWNNWTDGSPYLCTDVIIPSGARVYPSLDEEVVNGDEFGCNAIHFESGAAVERVFKLNYAKAWVDMTLEPNRNYLVSAPLKQMFTGDMFVPAAAADTLTQYSYFTDLTGANYRANRFAPRVYQRVWDKTAQNRLSDGNYGTATLLETNWSKRFNALSYGYAKGEGFSVFVDPEENTADNFTFRFPKHQTAYKYFNAIDKTESEFEEAGLDRTDNYRFIYESDATRSNTYTYTGLAVNDRALYNKLSAITIAATASANTTTFLVGNPFMSHINVEKFLDANSEKVASVKVFDGTVTSSAVSVDGGSTLVTNSGLTTIAPMEAFFVETKAETSVLDLVFTDDMFYIEDPDSDELSHRAMVSAITITAQTDKATAHALVLTADQPVASTLFDQEAMPEVAVFTLDGDRALDIRGAAEKEIIPLGIYVKSPAAVRLSFQTQGDADLDGYELLDRETGTTYSLSGDAPTFDALTTTYNRFALVPSVVTGIDVAEQLDGVTITVADRKALVKSGKADLRSVRAYTPDGRLIATAAGSPTLTVELAHGVNLIRVERNDAPARTYKVLAE